MFRLFASACVVSIALSSAAYAANCPNHPYNLTNGTNADANQVMADFNNLLTCANAILAPSASPVFTGNVGIGTASPTQTLEVAGNIRALNIIGPQNGAYGLYTDGTFSSGSAIQLLGSSSGLPNIIAFLTGSSLSERMRITSSGSIGIGTIGPSLLLTVNGTAGGTSAWQVISDARLKTNIQPVSNALALVTRLNPVRYDWREIKERSVGKDLKLPVGDRQIGFIAQEVDKIVPEAVTRPGKGTDATYSLKQENLIPLLVAAIKEQQAEIEQLRAKLNALSHASPN